MRREYLGAQIPTHPVTGQPLTEKQEAEVIPFDSKRARFVPVSQMVLREGKIVGWLVCSCDAGLPTWEGHTPDCPIFSGEEG